MRNRSLILGLFLCSTPASVWAQDASAADAETNADSGGFSDIVVTARKKSNLETVQSVPAAITAFDGAALADQHVTSLTQLAANVPSVQMSEGGAFKGSANFAMRGLGTISSIPTVEGTVGVFVDGVYLPTPQGVIFDLFDLEGIEILRGPQGTLFGKNVTGGAVLVRTRNPSTSFEVEGRASILTGPEYKLQGSISGPLSPTISARLSVSYDDDDGKYRDSITKIRRGYSETFLIRPSLAWEPSDGFRTVLKYEYGSIQGDAIPTQSKPFYPNDDFGFSNDYVGLTDLTWHQLTSETSIDVGIGDNGQITNVFGYRKMDDYANKDIDGTEKPLFHDDFYVGVKQYSNELRYSGRFFDAADIVLGVSYMNWDILSIEQRYLAALALAPRAFGGRQQAESYSLFAQTDIDILPNLTLTAGGRYGHENKKADIAIFSGAASRCNITALTCVFNVPRMEDSWSYFTPKVGLKFALTDYQQFYASWTKAYRAGGFNIRITNPNQNTKFDQESNSQFEIGTKLDLLDRRLRVNAAYYRSKIKNMIRDVNASLTSGGATIGTVQDSRNTADVTIQGFEFDARFRVTPELTIGGFVAYTHSKYNNILFSLVDLPGETLPVVNAGDYALRLPRLVPWQYGGSIDYDTDLSEALSLNIHADISHRDRTFAADNNSVSLPAFDNLNASITFGFGDRHSLSFFGRNLLDQPDIQVNGLIPASVSPGPTGGPTLVNYMPPQAGRVLGAEYTIKF